jgi:hypothetical protein
MSSPRRGLRALLGLDNEASLKRWDEWIALTVGLVVVLLFAGAAIAATAMIVQVYRHGEVPGSGNPLTVIFASRLMVAGARLAILALGIYIVVSVLMHMRRGQWLTAAGPFAVSSSLGKLEQQLKDRENQLRQSIEENRRLKITAADLTREVRTLERLLQQARTQLQRNEAK